MWNTIHRVGAGSLVVLVAVQALIAGRTIAVLMVVVAWWKLYSVPLRIIGVIIVVLVSAQIGLGYGARESESAAALHVPLGVAGNYTV